MDSFRARFANTGIFGTDHALSVSSAPASHFDFSPGNGSRYFGVAVDLPCSLQDPDSEERVAAVIVYSRRGSVVMTHSYDSYVHTNYVAEKTGLQGTDVDAVAALIAFYARCKTNSQYVFGPPRA